MKKPSMQTTLIIIAALVVAGGAYWYFFAGSGDEPALTATQGNTEAQAQFQSLVGELAPISFDTSIFTDARFSSLIDLATPVTPETSGRIDPFAPFSKN
jgi:hypothetical protein